MLRFDLEHNVPRKIMNLLHSAIYQGDIESAAMYLRQAGVKVHKGGSHVAILSGDTRLAIITEE